MKIAKVLISVLTAGAVYTVSQGFRSIPKGAHAIKSFNLKKYLGTWYEIARLDYRYERNLNNVSATYTLNKNGTIKVDNKGYNYKKSEWEESIGKAKPVKDLDEGMLKVSFFGPFYAGYNIIAIDEDYQYALVAGENTKYLWILSRKKTIPENVKKKYLAQAETLGFKINKLVWVEHTK